MSNERINIFVCSTMYHVLLSSLVAQTLRSIGKNILVIDITCYPNAKAYDWDSLSPLFDTALIFEDQEMQLNSKVDYLFYKASVRKKIENKFPLLKEIREAYSKNKIDVHCYVNEDGHNFSRYFIYSFQNIVMLEDGMQIYKEFVRKESFALKFLKYKMLGIVEPNGVDKRIKEIWVQYPEKLPNSIKEKGVKLNLFELFSSMERSDCMDVFKYILGFSAEVINLLSSTLVKKNNVTLLITQPFSEDKLITEDEKIGIYKRIIEDIEKKTQRIGCLIIKPHPRETTDYSRVFKTGVIIPNSFPLEMIRFACNKDEIKIALAVTVDSTAILNIQDFCERIQAYGNCDITRVLRNVYPLQNGYIK